MSNIAVKVVGLGKEYRIGGKQERYRTLRDSLTDAVSAPFKRARSLLHGQAYGAAGLEETIWALKDVSFEVKHGEVVGIIGRNGAGKSTLLKVLSRITEPTEGYADVYGRVGSLLEVGTGFHPELTGRENIYLNGAILGMTRAEIDHKFDEIVDFAEVERFIDTPVKHYSSGMGLRLGFAVAAHLEPEILVVDEVLAVGDAQFQKKCLGKMSDVAGEGRTVLFVSHNMAAVHLLCGKALVLEDGDVVFQGDTGQAIHQYLAVFNHEMPTTDNHLVNISHVRIGQNSDGTIASQEAFDVFCRIHVRDQLPGFRLFCIIEDSSGDPIVHDQIDHLVLPEISHPGTWDVHVELPTLWLRPGIYGFHFKLLANTVGLNKARFVSDTHIVSVTGNYHSEKLIGRLTPEIKWHAVQEKSSKQSGG